MGGPPIEVAVPVIPLAKPATDSVARLTGTVTARQVTPTATSTTRPIMIPSSWSENVVTTHTPTRVPGNRAGSDQPSPLQSMSWWSATSVRHGIRMATINSAPGISVGSSSAVTGAATRPTPRPTADCTVEPTRTAAAITAYVVGSTPPSCRGGTPTWPPGAARPGRRQARCAGPPEAPRPALGTTD